MSTQLATEIQAQTTSQAEIHKINIYIYSNLLQIKKKNIKKEEKVCNINICN